MSRRERPLLSLFQIGKAIHHLNKRSEREAGLSLVQWSLLEELIDMPGTSAFELAKAVGVHPSTLTQTLKRLERKEYIFIGDDPKDSRRKQVTLTKKGKQALEKVGARMDQWSRELASVGKDLRRINMVLHRY